MGQSASAWRKSVVLYDQTHHMDELIIEGPDAAAFLDHAGINNFANFDLNRAKHFVPVAPGVPLGTIFASVIPFWITMLVALAILVAFPQISLFLPDTMIK